MLYNEQSMNIFSPLQLFLCNYLYFICFTCTRYRYKTFIQDQKKKKKKRSP